MMIELDGLGAARSRSAAMRSTPWKRRSVAGCGRRCASRTSSRASAVAASPSWATGAGRGRAPRVPAPVRRRAARGDRRGRHRPDGEHRHGHRRGRVVEELFHRADLAVRAGPRDGHRHRAPVRPLPWARLRPARPAARRAAAGLRQRQAVLMYKPIVALTSSASPASRRAALAAPRARRGPARGVPAAGRRAGLTGGGCAGRCGRAPPPRRPSPPAASRSTSA